MTPQNNIGAIICPNCKKLISASAETCVHCGMKNPNMWGLASVFRKVFGGQVSLVPIITAFCIGLYVVSLLLDLGAILQPRGMLSFLSPSMGSLYKLGMTGSFAIDRGRWWTLITAIYLHGGLLHIFFNVMWIKQLGPPVEDLYGVPRSFLIFTVAGVAGFALSSFAGNNFTIGASGSIFGLLGAIIYYGRKRGGAFGAALYRQMGQWAIVLFIMGFLFPGIDNFAHAGGFAGGYAAAAVLGFTELKAENRNHQLAALAAIVLTVLAFLLTLIA